MSRYIFKADRHDGVCRFSVLLFIFVLLYITPGDPARQVLGLTATDEQVAAQRHIMGPASGSAIFEAVRRLSLQPLLQVQFGDLVQDWH